MAIEEFGIASYVGIVIICYLVGLALNVSKKTDSRYIPVVMGAVGAGLGIACYFGMGDFSENIIMAVARGIVSGLSATGINQIYKQLAKDTTTNENEDIMFVDAEAAAEEEKKEDDNSVG